MKQNATAIKKRAMIEALEKTLGVVTTAAKMVGIDRVTHYRWLEADEEYRENVDDVQNVVLDFAESALHKMVENHNPAATLFLLKTKGKKRGYIERQEIAHEGNVQSTLIEWKPADKEK
jgi:hypothetical protein